MLFKEGGEDGIGSRVKGGALHPRGHASIDFGKRGKASGFRCVSKFAVWMALRALA